MAERLDPRVRRYLADLDRAARGLPRARRRELVDDIRAELLASLAEWPDATPAEIDALLRKLGSPADIAAAAAENAGPSAARPRMALRDVVAVIAVLIGGIVVPIVGWVIGVILLWVSDAWRLRDKLIGTLLVPGGLLPALLLTMGVSTSSSSSTTCRQSATANDHCITVSSHPGVSVAGIVVLAVAVLGPAFTTCWLGYHARRQAPTVPLVLDAATVS